jgi:hypothetical protein
MPELAWVWTRCERRNIRVLSFFLFLEMNSLSTRTLYPRSAAAENFQAASRHPWVANVQGFLELQPTENANVARVGRARPKVQNVHTRRTRRANAVTRRLVEGSARSPLGSYQTFLREVRVTRHKYATQRVRRNT